MLNVLGVAAEAAMGDGAAEAEGERRGAAAQVSDQWTTCNL